MENVFNPFSVLDIRLCSIKLLLCPLMREACVQCYLRARPAAAVRHCMFLKHSLAQLCCCKFVKLLHWFKREFQCSHQPLGTAAVCVTIAVTPGASQLFFLPFFPFFVFILFCFVCLGFFDGFCLLFVFVVGWLLSQTCPGHRFHSPPKLSKSCSCCALLSLKRKK